MKWESPKLLFKAKTPQDLTQYVGKTVLIPEFANVDGKHFKIGETQVVIKTICGNRFKPQFYEINGEHLIGMLRFHAQMTGAKDITEDQYRSFEEMDIHAEKNPPKPKEVSHG